jgi:hypothetical protein
MSTPGLGILEAARTFAATTSKTPLAFKNQPHLVASHQLSWQPCSLTCSSRNSNLQYKLVTREMKEELILYSMAWAKNLVKIYIQVWKTITRNLMNA